MTFSSANSNDPDGNIVAYKWWYNNEVVSEESFWTSSFVTPTIYQIKLEVQDDNGAWSSKTSTNFKIIENTPPTVDFTFEQIGNSFVFNSTSSDSEGYIASYLWWNNEDNSVFSTEENFTWAPDEPGTYSITFRATDDGGMSSEVTKTVEFKLIEQKNFVVSFSSKNINPGDSFTMDFSSTTGTVDYYKVVVNNPNGSKVSYTVTIPTADGYNFSLTFPVKGVYTLDITVIWADGIAQGNMADFYGPTVNVGGDGTEDSEVKPSLDEGDVSGLPSISFFVTLLITSLIAINRRQR